MRRVYRLRLTSATGGNISCRAGADRFAITPSGIDKARIRAREVGLIDLEGRNLTPELKPSCEWLMHLRIYQRYPSVGAIVHAHPVTLSAFSCAETPIDIGLLSETYALLDPPVVAPYALMGTEELAEIVAECAGRSSAIILRNPGGHHGGRSGAGVQPAGGWKRRRVTLIARQRGSVGSRQSSAEVGPFHGARRPPARRTSFHGSCCPERESHHPAAASGAAHIWRAPFRETLPWRVPPAWLPRWPAWRTCCASTSTATSTTSGALPHDPGVAARADDLEPITGVLNLARQNVRYAG